MGTPIRCKRARRRRVAPARRFAHIALHSVLLAAFAEAAHAQVIAAVDDTLERIIVTGARPTSIPAEIPTTIESITRKQIDETINATDSEDALKYLPSLIVRKRYPGDYDHAVLGSRASGTGNSARSLVYADGLLLSNLLGNGAFFAPRWGMVGPEEIERVDVLYGPFSAAYPGNSVGAVVDYVTRMPNTTEAHLKLAGFNSHQRNYASDRRYGGGEGRAALGSRWGAFAWWVDASRLDVEAQPITFANRLLTAGTVGTAGTRVNGAMSDQNPRYQNWYILGEGTQTHTTQDHAKVKLAYDLATDVRATYVFGTWRNDTIRSARSYLTDAAGNTINSGTVNIEGRSFVLAATDFAPTRTRLDHDSHGLSFKSATRSIFDFEATASLYDYRRDIVRTPTVAVANASTAAVGTITDNKNTGWMTGAVKGTFRPDPASNVHVIEAGLQRDEFKLRTRVSATNDWIAGQPTGPVSRFEGNTELTSFWAQDAWTFLPDWKAIIGLRAERWTAHDGKIANATTLQTFGQRQVGDFSPKAALGYTGFPDWHLKASMGRAYRYPTVSELYQGSIVGGVVTLNDPNLRPERGITTELTAERMVANGSLRFTYFHERTHDALYSQTNVSVIPNVTNIQNVDLIRTNGFEFSGQYNDVFMKGLDVGASVTYADSKILANANFPASVGHRQPRVPNWRANLIVTWHATDALTATLGARYSGRQYGTLDNADPNGYTYTGFSAFTVIDARVRYKFDKNWSASFGIDNLNNKKYWAFHPYPERTYVAEVGFDM